MLVTRCWGSSSLPREASASRNICETGPVTGTGRCIGKVVAICTASRIPWCVKCSCRRNDPSNGAGGHLNGCPRTDTSTRPPSKSASASRKRSAEFEVARRIAQALCPGERVVLIAAFLEAWGARHVVVRAHRHDQEVSVVDADVGLDPSGGRVDPDHPLLAELDPVPGNVAVRQQHVVGRLATEHDLELGEAEKERV